MTPAILRAIAAFLAVSCLAACVAPTGPAGQPTASSLNPETGTRGGNGPK